MHVFQCSETWAHRKSPSNVALVDKGIVNEFVQLLIGIVRSGGKSRYQGWLEAGEPSVDSRH
jgi:hypothetical protein